jgi:hypothetical protein
LKTGWPESLTPKLISFGLFSTFAHWGVTIWNNFEIDIPEVFEATSHDLIGVGVYDFL